jgi:hypothetical protein
LPVIAERTKSTDNQVWLMKTRLRAAFSFAWLVSAIPLLTRADSLACWQLPVKWSRRLLDILNPRTSGILFPDVPVG